MMNEYDHLMRASRPATPIEFEEPQSEGPATLSPTRIPSRQSSMRRDPARDPSETDDVMEDEDNLPRFDLQLAARLPEQCLRPADVSFYKREDYENFEVWLRAQLEFGSVEEVSREEIEVFTNHLPVEKKEGGEPRFVGNFKPLNSATLKINLKDPLQQK